jgi:hypothetical protein
LISIAAALTAPNLHARRAVRHLLVVAAAAIDDQVELLCGKAGAGQCAQAGDMRHVDRRDV